MRKKWYNIGEREGVRNYVFPESFICNNLLVLYSVHHLGQFRNIYELQCGVPCALRVEKGSMQQAMTRFGALEKHIGLYQMPCTAHRLQAANH